jgi:hypothetical protein
VMVRVAVPVRMVRGVLGLAAGTAAHQPATVAHSVVHTEISA